MWELRPRIDALIAAAGLRRPADAALEAQVQAHFSGVRAAMSRFIMVCSLVLNGIWYLSDELTMGHLPGATEGVASLRVGVNLAGITVLAALWRQPRMDGARLWCCVAVWLAEFAHFGAGMARIADLATPWFYILFPLVMTPELLPLGFGRRALITSLMGVALLGGFLAVRPEAVASAHFPMTLSYMVFTVGVSVAFGHRIELLTRAAFVQRLSADHAAALLRQEREGLREQVLARTDELRRLASHLDQTSEAERARIARELHDDVGQSVSALRFAIATTLRRFARAPDSIAANLDDLDTLIGRVADGTRDAVTRLRPRLLDDRGLVEAAQWLVDTVARQCALDITLATAGDVARLAPAPGLIRAASPAALAGFRVLQEALNNAVKHAAATRVAVSLRVDPETFTLEIQDDGRGLGLDRPLGLGLITMRERALELGGSLEITARPAGGTRVSCTLPHAPPEAS